MDSKTFGLLANFHFLLHLNSTLGTIPSIARAFRVCRAWNRVRCRCFIFWNVVLGGKCVGWNAGCATCITDAQMYWENVPRGGDVDFISFNKFLFEMTRHCASEDLTVRFGEEAHMVYPSIRAMLWKLAVVEIEGWRPVFLHPATCEARSVVMDIDALESHWLDSADEANIGLLVDREPRESEWRVSDAQWRVCQRISSVEIDARIHGSFLDVILNTNLKVIKTHIRSPLRPDMYRIMDSRPRSFISQLKTCGWILFELGTCLGFWKCLDEWMLRFDLLRHVKITYFATDENDDVATERGYRKKCRRTLDTLDFCVVWTRQKDDKNLESRDLKRCGFQFARKVNVKMI